MSQPNKLINQIIVFTTDEKELCGRPSGRELGGHVNVHSAVRVSWLQLSVEHPRWQAAGTGVCARLGKQICHQLVIRNLHSDKMDTRIRMSL